MKDVRFTAETARKIVDSPAVTKIVQAIPDPAVAAAADPAEVAPPVDANEVARHAAAISANARAIVEHPVTSKLATLAVTVSDSKKLWVLIKTALWGAICFVILGWVAVIMYVRAGLLG